jgi:hypothetical protein
MSIARPDRGDTVRREVVSEQLGRLVLQRI